MHNFWFHLKYIYILIFQTFIYVHYKSNHWKSWFFRRMFSEKHFNFIFPLLRLVAIFHVISICQLPPHWVCLLLFWVIYFRDLFKRNLNLYHNVPLLLCLWSHPSSEACFYQDSWDVEQKELWLLMMQNVLRQAVLHFIWPPCGYIWESNCRQSKSFCLKLVQILNTMYYSIPALSNFSHFSSSWKNPNGPFFLECFNCCLLIT